MISPNLTPDLPTEDTENPNRIETPESPRKDSSTTVQNACVTGETDPSNHANAVVMTTSYSMIDNQRPEEQKDCSSPALITPVPKVIDRNPTLHSLSEQKDISTPAPIPSAARVTDAGNNNAITTISGPSDAVVMTTSYSMTDNQRPEERKDFSSPALITPVPKVIDHNPTLHSLPEQKNVSTPAPIPSTAAVTDAGNNATTTNSGPIISDDADSLHNVNVTVEAIPDPRIGVNPTPGSPDPLKSNLGQEKFDSDFIPFVAESTLPSEITSRKAQCLSYSEDTSGNNPSDKVNPGATSHSDSHNTGGNVDTGTADTLPAQPSVTNVAGNKSPGNDNTGTGSVSTIADTSVIGDRIFETTHHPSSSNAGHPIATTNHPFSDSNVLSADMAFGSKVGGILNRIVNPHAVDNSSYQDKNENVNRRRWSPAIVGPKRKKTIFAKVGHTANKQPIPLMDKV
jgi:hypothetical protein